MAWADMGKVLLRFVRQSGIISDTVRREAVAGRVEVPAKASCQNINTPEAKESQRQTVRSHGYTGRYVFNADKL